MNVAWISLPHWSRRMTGSQPMTGHAVLIRIVPLTSAWPRLGMKSAPIPPRPPLTAGVNGGPLSVAQLSTAFSGGCCVADLIKTLRGVRGMLRNAINLPMHMHGGEMRKMHDHLDTVLVEYGEDEKRLSQSGKTHVPPLLLKRMRAKQNGGRDNG